jgi:1,4-alpha-glucan branching enzyme
VSSSIAKESSVYESFGFSRSPKNEQLLTLFVPDSAIDPAQYKRGGPCRITEVRVVSDFQATLVPGSTNWDAATALAMTKKLHPNGWTWEYVFPTPLQDGFYQYQYIVRFEDGTVRRVGDPCTKYGGDAQDHSGFVVGGSLVQTEPLADRLPSGDLQVYELMIDDFTVEYRGNRAPVDAVIDKLDVLASLNVNAIEFMPWISWPDDADFSWGYDPAYFFSVESKYVSDVANPVDRLSRLARLITECHRRKLHVLLDIVLQHARQGSGTNGFPYHWLWQNPVESPFVGAFTAASSFNMLPLDYHNACTQEFVGDVCKYWLARFQLDGLRFDQVSGYNNPDFPAQGAPALMADLRTWLAARKLNNVSLVLEDTWGFDAIDDSNSIRPTATWFDPFRSAPFGIFSGYAATGHVNSRYMRVLNAAKDFNWPIGPLTYIENHDHGSVTCRVGGRERWFKAQPYMIALATCPGAVMLHNGQEWGQFEDIWEDDFNAPYANRRVQPRPLRWSEAGDQIGSTVRDRYAFLLDLRLRHPGLRSPNFYPNAYDEAWRHFSPEGYGIDEDRQVALYHRWGADSTGALERFIVVLNFSDQTQFVDVPFSTNGTWSDLLEGGRAYTVVDFRLFGLGVASNWGCVFWQK